MLALFVVPFNSVQAQTIEDLNAMIAQLVYQLCLAQGGTNCVPPTPTPPPTLPAVNPVCFGYSRPLFVGSQGEDVKMLQLFLQQRGYFTGVANGLFEISTKTALTQFQQSAGILATGYFGPVTIAYLKTLCQSTNVPTLSILTPNGGESYITGESTINIDYQYSPSSIGSQPITAYLWSQNSGIGRSVHSTLGAGTLVMQLAKGDLVETPGQYKILLCTDNAMSSSGDQLCDYSDNFFYLTNGSTNSNQPPSISGVSGPTVLNTNQSGTWSLTASDPENGTLSYSVDWGDNKTGKGVKGATSGVSQTATFTHSYSAPGNYTVTLKVSDNAGQSAHSTLSVVVGGSSSNAAPSITYYELPVGASVGETVNFYLEASDPDGDNLSWSGSIQDVNSGAGFAGSCPSSQPNTSFNTSKKWNTPGTYTVNFKVSDCKGGTDSKSVTVNVGGIVPPVAPLIMLTPNGGEVWTTGSTQGIKWNDPNYVTGTQYVVSARYYTQTEVVYLLGQVTNGQSFNWTVGQHQSGTIPVYDKNYYYIGVCRIPPGSTIYAGCDDSDNYISITTNTPPTPTLTPSLKLTKPSNGVNQLIGSQKSIEWTSSNVPASNLMFIRYYNLSGVPLITSVPIAQGQNDGVQVITVPNLPVGQYYLELSTQPVSGVNLSDKKLINITSPTSSIDSNLQYASTISAIQNLIEALRARVGASQ